LDMVNGTQMSIKVLPKWKLRPKAITNNDSWPGSEPTIHHLHDVDLRLWTEVGAETGSEVVVEPGTNVHDFKNIFAEKNCEKVAFSTQNKARLCKILIKTLIFEKNAIFFAKSWQKSQKLQ
jgi:hypothetical protein